MYSITTICEVLDGEFLQRDADVEVDHLVYDSRRVQQGASSLFFAIRTSHNDGHKYLQQAYKKGVRNFVVSDAVTIGGLEGSTIIKVENSLLALQQLSAFHRRHFSIPVIGITGSNGKTIVKEWLNILLQNDHSIVRSPKSFNSQIGVPLSVWQLNTQHTLGIFEAGISHAGEMKNLQPVIQPTIGILTNLGEAHSEGFLDNEQKLSEKLMLFKECPILVARNKDVGGRKELLHKSTKLLTWGSAENNDFVIRSIEKKEDLSTITIGFAEGDFSFRIPFTDDASIENVITCICVLSVLNYKNEEIQQRLSQLHAIDMRLQLDHSFNSCIVINDSYSADITSLKIALDFLKQQGSGLSKTVILSEFFESGKTEEELYSEIASLVSDHEVKKLVVVGERIGESLAPKLTQAVAFTNYLSTDDFIKEFRSSQFDHEIILIKGARRFGFEKLAKLFEKKLHQTALQVNLNALAHNLKEYQRIVKPGTKVMAMVKAFSYGSGGAEIASVLQFHNVDYLGVAYADEGVELVKSGIHLPIMVMNAEASSFTSIVDFGLQPVIYSKEILHEFETYLLQEGLSSYPVHIEIETGMNRLGFPLSEVDAIAQHISSKSLFSIQSVFSHLAASEDAAEDEFTNKQASAFNEATSIIEKYIASPFLKHISNSAAIVRHPHLQLDMVRLGIGLYGIETDNDRLLDLHAVATLRTTIAQIKHLKKGESVSYNRRGVVKRDSVIATVRIGYADGYSRKYGNGVGKMLVNGALAPVIGTVCMDMTMIDVTDIKGVEEGDEVILFGTQLPVQEVASWVGTIPYEIMTGISHRVKRVYFHE